MMVRLLAQVGLTGVLLLGTGFAPVSRGGAAPDPTPLPPPATLIFPKGPADGMLWPHDWSYIWQINRLDAPAEGDRVALEIRTQRVPWDGGTPAVPYLIPKDKSEKTHRLEPGRANPPEQMPVRLVSVQVIDMSKVALPAGKDSFRLVAGLKGGVGTSLFSGENSVIPGKVVSIFTMGTEAKWKKGEMHLVDLFVRDKEQLGIYSFVLVQSK